MNEITKKRFVLVHGAWTGGWVWSDVVSRLRTLGHTATAPTLSGLGDRRTAGGNTVDLETHVDDIVAHVESEDLHGITLVGWSYGGMVTTGVLARMPQRIRQMVYLDAFVPQDGKAAADYLPLAGKAAYDRLREDDLPLPPRPLALHGVTSPALIATLEPRLTPQPWRTFYKPVKALKDRPNIPISYVALTGYTHSVFATTLSAMEADPQVKVSRLRTSHYCMFTALDQTIDVLTGG